SELPRTSTSQSWASGGSSAPKRGASETASTASTSSAVSASGEPGRSVITTRGSSAPGGGSGAAPASRPSTVTLAPSAQQATASVSRFQCGGRSTTTSSSGSRAISSCRCPIALITQFATTCPDSSMRAASPYQASAGRGPVLSSALSSRAAVCGDRGAAG